MEAEIIADQIIEKMKDWDLSPDEMLEVIKVAKPKLDYLKNKSA